MIPPPMASARSSSSEKDAGGEKKRRLLLLLFTGTCTKSASPNTFDTSKCALTGFLLSSATLRWTDNTTFQKDGFEFVRIFTSLGIE